MLVNPLTAGTDYIRLSACLLACSISAFKHIEAEM